MGTLLVLAVAMLGATSSASGATGSTLTVVSNTQISTFNPFISFSDGELDLIGNVYPALTTVNEKGEAAPYLATSWKTSQDGLTWTFAIHSGLKWTDGQPITANDAAWTFNLIMTNKVAATSNGSLVSNFASVSAPNDTTLIIKTKKPQSNMLYVSVPVSGIAIVPEHIWKSKVANLKAFTNMDFPVVGYGPWILTGNVTNQYATMTANKDFFMGAPKFDTLISRYFTSSDASAAALKSGELTQNGGITSTQYLALKNEKNVKTYQTEPNSWKAIEINSGAKTQSGKPMGTGNPLLADPVVRRAIALAIDRKPLVAKVADGLAQTGAGY
ncbi:MAG: ABC transporter substrate-binding protein, partial [Actinomycetota bacterium]|nr:ABC transporter substrate-binding protein [Actinomycetota bacterium]